MANFPFPTPPDSLQIQVGLVNIQLWFIVSYVTLCIYRSCVIVPCVGVGLPVLCVSVCALVSMCVCVCECVFVCVCVYACMHVIV